MSTNKEEFFGAVAASLKGTEAGGKWVFLTTSECRQFREIVLEEAVKLPERQKIVATCYMDVFEVVINEGSFWALAEEVSRVTRKQETVAAGYSDRIAENTLRPTRDHAVVANKVTLLIKTRRPTDRYCAEQRRNTTGLLPDQHEKTPIGTGRIAKAASMVHNSGRIASSL